MMPVLGIYLTVQKARHSSWAHLFFDVLVTIDRPAQSYLRSWYVGKRDGRLVIKAVLCGVER